VTLKDFVRRLIDIQLGMLDIHISAFKQLRDKSNSSEYQQGVQDCIDIIEESVITGMSITDDEICDKERSLQAVLGTMMANKGSN
jgi:hypothetical protein